MEHIQTSNQFNTDAQEGESNISIRELVFIVINNWYWFAISAAVCLLIAAFVYKSKPKTYTQAATILLRDDKGSSKGGQQMDAIFANMGFNTSSLSLENEIHILKSSPLMASVVERLGLATVCTRNGLFRKITYYKDCPLDLTVYNRDFDNENFAVNITVEPVDDQHYKYRITSLNGQSVKSDWQEAMYNQVVNINTGVSFSVERTAYYRDNDCGVSFHFASHTPAKVAKTMLRRLTVSRVEKNADIISITFDDPNSLRAREIVDTLIVVYNEDVVNDKNRVAQKTEDFIAERIALISGELSDVDNQVANLYKSAGVTDLENARSMLLTKGTQYSEATLSIETELDLAQQVRAYVVDPNHKNDLLPSNVGVNDGGVQSMISDYNKQLLHYQKLLNTAGANNPNLRTTERELEATRVAIVASIDNYLNSLNIKLQSSRDQESRAKRQITDMPTQAKAVAEVSRQQKIKEELYLYLLSKREENALAQAVTVANAKVVERADLMRVAPNITMYGLVGLVLGLALPAAVMFCISFFNTKLRSKADVEQALTIPVLGEIPSKPEEKANEDVIVTATGTDVVTEAFRILHSNIPFFLNGSDKKVIQTVSTVPGEGKSYVSVNLALSLAYLGKKTCLVDLDLRKRSTSKVIDRHNRMGIIHYLLGSETDIDRIITRSESSENLHYIVCEKTPPNATQLLLSEKFDALAAYLREHYDYVIFDSTPAQIVADAAIINRTADLTLYVMRIGVLRKTSFPFIQELNDKKRFNNMAIVLTDTPLIKKRYGGYGYGYGYGYGEEDSASSPKKS